MAAAAALELQLSLFVIKKRVIDINDGEAQPLSKEELAVFAETARKKTLPKLITQVRRSFKLSDALIDGLNIAKQARDYLAHEFWQVNIGFIQSPEGVELIVRQCSLDAWHFKELAKDLEKEIGFDVDDFTAQSGVSAQAKHNELSELLSKYDSENNQRASE